MLDATRMLVVFAALALAGCAPETISAASETDETGETGETGELPLGEPCFTEVVSGYDTIWETQFAWGELIVINRRFGELIVGEGDTWFVGKPSAGSYGFWGTSASELFAELSGGVVIWDGESETGILDAQGIVPGVTPSGDIWIATEAGEVLRWTGDAYEAATEPLPFLSEPKGLIAGDDERRIAVSDDHELASQLGDAAWVIEASPPGLGPLDSLRLFRADGQGGLWLVAGRDDVKLRHRDAQGVWSSASYVPQYTIWNVSTAALGDELYLFDDVDHSLWRWTGAGPLEFVASLPGYKLIFASHDRMFGVDIGHGQAIVEIEPGSGPGLTTLWSVSGVAPSRRNSATTLDAVYQLGSGSLRRWSEGWTYLADSSVSADPKSGFRGLWAESKDIAWISEIVDGGSPRTRLYRWVGDALTPLAHDIDPSVAIHGLWGSSAERVFGWGLDPLGAASIWRYDGEGWSAVPLPMPGYVPSVVTGTDESLYMLDSEGRGFGLTGDSWEQLPLAPTGPLVDHDLIAAAGTLFYRRAASDAFTFYSANELFVLDADGWIRVDERWPAGPPTDVEAASGDGTGGLWVTQRDAELAPLFHFDGSEWTAIEVEAPVEVLGSGQLVGAPEGAIVHGEQRTQQYRLACE